MNAPATTHDVIRALTLLTSELQGKVSALRDAELDAALKRHDADMSRARAFLVSEGTEKAREYIAREASDRQEGAAKTAEALVRILRSEIRAVETRIDVGRTYGATVRAELKTLDYQGGP